MALSQYLRIEEIIQAFEEMGGEAEWKEIEKSITKKRGGSYAPYLDWRNFNNTMFQFVQQHCEGYKKFIGPVYFEKVLKDDFVWLQCGLPKKLRHLMQANPSLP